MANKNMKGWPSPVKPVNFKGIEEVTSGEPFDLAGPIESPERRLRFGERWGQGPIRNRHSQFVIEKRPYGLEIDETTDPDHRTGWEVWSGPASCETLLTYFISAINTDSIDTENNEWRVRNVQDKE